MYFLSTSKSVFLVYWLTPLCVVTGTVHIIRDCTHSGVVFLPFRELGYVGVCFAVFVFSIVSGVMGHTVIKDVQVKNMLLLS